MLARTRILTLLIGLSLMACESQPEGPQPLIIPSANGTIAFLDEPGNEIHLRARVVWDSSCGHRFQIVADSSDPRFAGLPFLEFQMPFVTGSAIRSFTTRRHSGDSVRVWQSTAGNMYIKSIDLLKKTVSGGMHVFFPGTTPPETIYYTWGSFTNLPFEVLPLYDSNMHFRHYNETWMSHVSDMRVFNDSVTLDGSACGFPSLRQVHITIAHPDTGVFALDAFTHVSFIAIPHAVPGHPSFPEQFSTVLTRKEDAGTITITKLDVSRNIIEGTFSITATAPSGSKIVLREGVVRYGTR